MLTSTVILTAIENLADESIRELYSVLKEAISRELGENSDLVSIMDQLEDKPDSGEYLIELNDGIKATEAKIVANDEIVKAAQDLINEISRLRSRFDESVGYSASGGNGGYGLDALDISGSLLGDPPPDPPLQN